MPDISISPIFPGELLLSELLKTWRTEREFVMSAPESYKEGYFKRIASHEEFWFGLFDKLGKRILSALPESTDEIVEVK